MNVYGIDGNVEKSIELPGIFKGTFREDIVRRALLSEQSRRYQPQAHDVMAGLRTTAVYVGNYKSYRTGRHMGIAIRPRQRLGGGSMGDVRRIPSATKGRRAHPHHLEKIIEEHINRKEYMLAIKSAIAGCSDSAMIKKGHRIAELSMPIVVDNKLESISKSKELSSIMDKLGLAKDLEASHKPRLRKGLRRASNKRHFRNSVLIVVSDSKHIEKAGRNIPGVDVCSIKQLSIGKLAPGAIPRPSIWTEGAVHGVEKEVEARA
ncbi:MAG: 50S ribosomal protein L4 [Candidatus Micrarchaeota archaeon]|nr:50S ribosomal protein L4 [Candidatus Micrarchaeota archaeon]